MRRLLLFLLFALPAPAQDIDIVVRPDAVYVETIAANLVPMERLFFHIVVENQSNAAVTVEWLRFDIVNSKGVLFSGQYSGAALVELFDSAIERKRIEPTTRQTLDIDPGQRKAVSDIFLDFPKGL